MTRPTRAEVADALSVALPAPVESFQGLLPPGVAPEVRYAVLVVVVPDVERTLGRLASLVTRVRGIEFDLTEHQAMARAEGL